MSISAAQKSDHALLHRAGRKYLMLHRVKKERTLTKDKWIGVGGHFEADESPEDCVLREVKEETGYTLTGLPVPGNHHLFIPGRL